MGSPLSDMDFHRTPSPGRHQSESRCKTLHSPWTAPRVRKKGRSSPSAHPQEIKEDASDEQELVQRNVLGDVSNFTHGRQFAFGNSEFDSSHNASRRPGSFHWMPPLTKRPLSAAPPTNVEKVLPGDVAAGPVGQPMLQNAVQPHTAARPLPVASTIGFTATGLLADTSLGPSQLGVLQPATQNVQPMGGLPPQPQPQKRRFLARVRSKGLSWHSSLGRAADGAAGEGVGPSGVDAPDAQGGPQGKGWRGRKRPSPPTPWPRRRSPELTDAGIIQPAGPPRPVTAGATRSLSRFVASSIKQYFPAKESLRRSSPFKQTKSPPAVSANAVAQPPVRKLLGGQKAGAGAAGPHQSLLSSWGFQIGNSRRSSSGGESQSAGSPMQESPAPASGTTQRGLSRLRGGAASLSVPPQAIQESGPLTDSPTSLAREWGGSPRSGTASDVLVSPRPSELDSEGPVSCDMSIGSFPTPMQVRRCDVSEDGSLASYPTPLFAGRVGGHLSDDAASDVSDALVSIARAGSGGTNGAGCPFRPPRLPSDDMLPYDVVYPTPMVGQGACAVPAAEDAGAPMKQREAAATPPLTAKDVTDLATFNKRLQRAVEEGDVDTVGSAVEAVKGGDLLPDIDTLNNLLMCFCKVQGDPVEAEDLVKATCRRAKLQPNSATYHCLTAMWMRQEQTDHA